ncbi:MAG: PHB depolymerase family esterase [Chloroflexota bacterium]|nr:PHB depolymerase family esterase [Chloroflexota bacterium]
MEETIVARARRCFAITGLTVFLILKTIIGTRPGRWALVSAQTLTVIDCSEVNPTPGDYLVEVESSGQTRQFRLHIPLGHQASNPMPLVINLHGYGGSGAQQEVLSDMSDKADEAGFIAVHPEGRGTPQGWYVGPAVEGQQEDVQFIRDLVHCLEDRLSIDPVRVYATGFSNGGGMANRLGCDLSDVIAAIGPVSGAYFSFDICQPVRPVPVVAFHGTADEIVPYDGGALLPPIPEWAADWAVRNDCSLTSTVTYSQGDIVGETWADCTDNATVTLYTIEDGRHTWPGSDSPGATQDITATDTIWEFFSAHSLRRLVYLPLVLRAY